ncbi:MAG TPA: hypothetical protein VKA55_08270 [Gammaproteobacteria bacterium]|nr:hypothetical protein [Gammaproteobacteria bacterium]
MSSNFKKNTAYLSAVGTAFAVTLAASAGTASAEPANPFVVSDLGSGYMVAAAEGNCSGNAAEKKAGEGNCSASKAKEGDCSAKEKEAEKGGEGKCGEGKCASS